MASEKRLPLVTDLMSTLMPLLKYLKSGCPLTVLQVESISLAHETFGVFLDVWKRQHGYTRKRDKLPRAWFAMMDASKSGRPNPAAVALGRIGGLKGGRARASKLSAARRREIARLAVTARWARTSRQR